MQGIKKWLWVGLALVFILVVVFFVNTEPAEKKEENDMDTSISIGNQWEDPPAMSIDAEKSYSATLVTSKGDMRLQLHAKETPQTVNNFIFLARDGFYDGVKFHRIIKDFMVQTGDPRGDGTGGPGYSFDDEEITRDYTRGTLAMANSGPNTNGSQFFIIHKDYDLPKQYVIFGAIDPDDEESLATLDAIAETPVEESAGGEKSVPSEDVILTSVTISEE